LTKYSELAGDMGDADFMPFGVGEASGRLEGTQIQVKENKG
jgi:hypothetical protein